MLKKFFNPKILKKKSDTPVCLNKMEDKYFKAYILDSVIIVFQGFAWAPLPFLVYGACSLIAGIVSCFLPETLNRRLPETLEDVENIHK